MTKMVYLTKDKKRLQMEGIVNLRQNIKNIF